MSDNEDVNLDKEVRASITINELDLETELASVASFYYRFSALANDAELIYQRAELELEKYEVDLAKAIRKQLLEEGMKADKITESEIKRAFRKDDNWLRLKNTVMEAESDYKKLEKAAKAFDMKSQNCMSLNKRQLYKASKGMINTEDL